MLIMALPMSAVHVPLTVASYVPNGMTGVLSATRTVVNKILPTGSHLVPAHPTGTFIRVLVRGPSSGQTVFTEMCVSRPATSGDPWDSASDIVNLTFANSDGVTVTANQERYSDWVSYQYDRAFGLIVAADVASGSRIASTGVGGVPGNHPTYYKNSVTDADNTNRGSAYTAVPGYIYFLKSIEIAVE